MPVYNEEARLPEALKQALSVDYPCDVEFVVVNDGSQDGTAEILARVDDTRVTVVTQPRNQGKGAAIRAGVERATGTYLVILDADLEYDPQDIPRLLAPVLDGRAEVVYGNRTFGSHSSFSFWYVMGNKAVTTAANMMFNCYLGDLETCFKLMPVELYRSLDVKSKGFGMEAEVTGKLLRRAHPRGGQEDHLAGRGGGAVDPGPRADAPAAPRRRRPVALLAASAGVLAVGLVMLVAGFLSRRDAVPSTSSTGSSATASGPAPSASTVKLALATALLESARVGQVTLDATARQQLADMLNWSSDKAADALWDRYGGAALVPRFTSKYGMAKLAFVAGFPRRWGHMKCTPGDLAALMLYILDRLLPEDRAYLIDAMRAVGPVQRWGVWAAGPDLRPGTKNGWSVEPDGGTRHWVADTVGFAGPDERYVVAAMYH